MEKAKNVLMQEVSFAGGDSYEISARREEMAVDFYSFFYGDVEAESDDSAEEQEGELTKAEQGAFLKSTLLLFAGAVVTVLAVLLI